MTETQFVRARHATSTPGHPVLRYLGFALVAAAGFGLVFVQTYKAQIEAEITTEDITPLLGPDRPDVVVNPEDGAKGKAVNILLMGSDAGSDREGKRNDTTLIMHVSADRKRVELVSIPRDTMVQLAACQRSDGSTQRAYFGQFNEAFGNGARRTNLDSDGAACSIKTVEGITNLYIDHYVVIDFRGFENMVNAVKGVPVCIPVKYADPFSGTYLDPGPQVLGGKQALAYVRMRHGANTDGSDLDRIDRQQEFLKNLASKVLSAEMLYRPQDITAFIKAVAQSITTDPQFGDLDYLAGLGFSLRNLDPGSGIVMATAPIEAYPPNHNRVQLNSKAPAIWEALRNDQPIAGLLDSQSASPANSSGTSGEAPATDDGVDPNSQEGILAACAA